MIHTAKQLKDLIRNLSAKTNVNAQYLMRAYMIERFCERLSLSRYKDQFVLKGGMLIAAMVGQNVRSTMDADVTVKGFPLSVELLTSIFKEVIAIPMEDGVTFSITRVDDIMDEATYTGLRVGIEALLEQSKIPFKIDVSTGDAITPREIHFQYPLMFEARSIEICAYNLETILAEKLETIISRATTNTRMRDFYDIYTLSKLYGEQINHSILRRAVQATAANRGTLKQLKCAPQVFSDIATSTSMQRLWANYQHNFEYARDISWGNAVDAATVMEQRVHILKEKDAR